MNKGDLIKKVAEVLNSKKEAQTAVNCVIQSITEALANKDSVTLIGLGTFKTANRQARKGRNPQTGKEINIPARNVPKFSPGKALKEAVN
jgi:DNA-binding protein HU-beta